MEWQTIQEPPRHIREKVKVREASANMDKNYTVKIQCFLYEKTTVTWPHQLEPVVPLPCFSLSMPKKLQNGKSDHSLW